MKAEQFIKDCTKTCSNEMVAKESCFHEWVTPEQALKAIEIAKEEWLSKACDAYCKVCKIPTHICRQDCNYYNYFRKVMED